MDDVTKLFTIHLPSWLQWFVFLLLLLGLLLKVYTDLGIHRRIKKMSKEFVPNAGGTMKDQLNRIEKDVTKVRTKQDATNALDERAMFFTDNEGRITEVNAAWCSLLGMMPNEALNRGWYNFVPDELRPELISRMEDVVKLHMDYSGPMTFRSKYPGGNHIYVDVKMHWMKDTQGDFIGAHGVVLLDPLDRVEVVEPIKPKPRGRIADR
jgi:PAS domain S-box-containing protein